MNEGAQKKGTSLTVILTYPHMLLSTFRNDLNYFQTSLVISRARKSRIPWPQEVPSKTWAKKRFPVTVFGVKIVSQSSLLQLEILIETAAVKLDTVFLKKSFLKRWHFKMPTQKNCPLFSFYGQCHFVEEKMLKCCFVILQNKSEYLFLFLQGMTDYLHIWLLITAARWNKNMDNGTSEEKCVGP